MDPNSLIYENDKEELLAIEELSNCITPVIKRLPPEYQEIISMSELQGIPQKEIAKKLHMNYTTVRSKVQRGRKKMKELYIKFCGDVLKEGLMGYQPEECETKTNCKEQCS
jgi:RNA polymerase sigma-70 factor (ECF subfamily)